MTVHFDLVCWISHKIREEESWRTWVRESKSDSFLDHPQAGERDYYMASVIQPQNNTCVVGILLKKFKNFMTRHTEKHISCSYKLQNGYPWWVHIHIIIQRPKPLLSFDSWGLLPLKEIICLWLAHVITRKWMSHGRCFMLRI